jgi:drug/metabolite transporter (DMT)-like permease
MLALANLFWAGNWVVGRALRDLTPPVTLNFGRWLVAAAVLAPFAAPGLLARGGLLRSRWGLVLGLALAGIVVFQDFVYVGLRYTTATNAVLLNATLPLVIALCSWAMDGTAPTRRQLAGVAVSTAGVLCILSRGDPSTLLGLDFGLGDLVILVAMPAFGAYSVLLRRKPAGLGQVELLFAVSVVALAFLAPASAAEVAAVGGPTWSPALVAGFAFVGVFASAGAYACWSSGVEAVGANRAGYSMHLLPAFGTGLAVAFLGEQPHWFHLAGFATILAGVVLAARK